MTKNNENSEPVKDAITGKAMPEASPAATVVIFRESEGDEPPEILMVERSSKMAFAAGAAVFPGGRVDEADFDYARALGHEDVDEYGARIAAIREAIEETGVAVAVSGNVDAERLLHARDALNSGTAISEICDKFDWELQLDTLIPFARWRPPFAERRIFDTRFYIVADDDDTIEAIVDDTENYNLFWSSAKGVLEKDSNGDIKIIFPTRRNLERLALFQGLEDAREHVAKFPVQLVSPHIEERDGEQFLCIPEDIGYPVTSESFESVKRG